MGTCRSKKNKQSGNNEEKLNVCDESANDTENILIEMEQKESGLEEKKEDGCNKIQMIGELSRYISELKCEIRMLNKKQQLNEIKNDSKFENIEKNLNIYKKTEELVNDFRKEKEGSRKISRKILDKYVDKLIEDENVNIDFLPDFIEKKIYSNIFTLILGILDNILDTVEIRFLDHKIEFDLIPEY